MASPLRLFSRIRFGAFELDAASGELRKADIPIKLRHQAIQVLVMLTERAGQVVTREEIRERLWNHDTFVDFERSINFCVNQIRAVLGDDAEKPRYIETLPRRGYRFIASITTDPSREPGMTATPAAVTGSVVRSAVESDADSFTTSWAQVAPSTRARVPVTPLSRNRLLVLAVPAVVAVMAVGFGLHRWASRKPKLGISLENMQIRKLTDGGTAEDTAISPDGRYVVYALREGEKQSLWLRQVGTRSDVQILPPDITGFRGLTFSPDGNYIYVVRSHKNNPFFKSLFMMPVLGGSARQLITDVDSPVSLSPDGHRLIFERGIESKNSVELRIANVDGSDERLLTAFDASTSLFLPGLDWSPDGKTIAISLQLLGNQEKWALTTFSVADGTVRELYANSDFIGRPAWLPEGNALLVPMRDPGGRSQLWSVSYPEGEARRLTNDLADYASKLAITRDGRAVVAIATSTQSNAWVVPQADPLKGKQITFGEVPMKEIAEAGDGRILTVSADGDLWVMNHDGSYRALFNGIHDAGWLTPCGRFTLFVSSESATPVLTRVDANGSSAQKLASGRLWSPTCSPDGRFAFYVGLTHPQKIWRIPVEGGLSTEVAEILGDNRSGLVTISPDGRFLAYAYSVYTGTPEPGWKLAVIPAGGGPPVETIRVPGGIVGPRWSPSGKGLQYLLTRDGATNLWEQPLAGGEPRLITKFTSGQIFDFNWTADKKQLLLTRGEVTSDVVLLINPH